MLRAVYPTVRAMATSPRVLAGSVLHAEALRSAQSYTSHWDELQNPAGDMPYGEAAPPEASFTREQLGHFTREGYVVLRGFYSLQELEALRSSTHEVLARLGRERQGEQCSADMFCEEEFNPVKDTCSHHRSLAANAELSDGQCASLCADGDVAFAPVSGPSDVSNPHRVGYVNDIHLHHRALAPTEAHPKLLNCLRELLGPDIDAWQVATVVKSPGLRWWGGGYSWHQVRIARLSRTMVAHHTLAIIPTQRLLDARRSCSASWTGYRRLRWVRGHEWAGLLAHFTGF